MKNMKTQQTECHNSLTSCLDYITKLGTCPSIHRSNGLDGLKTSQMKDPKVCGMFICQSHTQAMEDPRDYQQYIEIEQARRCGLFWPIDSHHSRDDRTSHRQERNNYAVFLDYFSELPYLVLQWSLMGEETVRAKASFKGYAQRHGVSIMYYHKGNHLTKQITSV